MTGHWQLDYELISPTGQKLSASTLTKRHIRRTEFKMFLNVEDQAKVVYGGWEAEYLDCSPVGVLEDE